MIRRKIIAGKLMIDTHHSSTLTCSNLLARPPIAANEAGAACPLPPPTSPGDVTFASFPLAASKYIPPSTTASAGGAGNNASGSGTPPSIVSVERGAGGRLHAFDWRVAHSAAAPAPPICHLGGNAGMPSLQQSASDETEGDGGNSVPLESVLLTEPPSAERGRPNGVNTPPPSPPLALLSMKGVGDRAAAAAAAAVTSPRALPPPPLPTPLPLKREGPARRVAPKLVSFWVM